MNYFKSIMLTAFALFALAACDTDDLRDDVDNLKDRVESLEAQVSQFYYIGTNRTGSSNE